MKFLRPFSVLIYFIFTALPCLIHAQDNQKNFLPTQLLENFVGIWHAPDSILSKYPDMAKQPLITWEWGSNRKTIKIFEHHSEGNKEKGVFEGHIYWNPVTNKIEFFGYNKQDNFLFKGEFTILEQEKTQRIYDVYYPQTHQFYKSGNAVISFKETYTLSDDKNIKYNHLLYYNKKENRWDLWGNSTMIRKND